MDSPRNGKENEVCLLDSTRNRLPISILRFPASRPEKQIAFRDTVSEDSPDR